MVVLEERNSKCGKIELIAEQNGPVASLTGYPQWQYAVRLRHTDVSAFSKDHGLVNRAFYGDPKAIALLLKPLLEHS